MRWLTLLLLGAMATPAMAQDADFGRDQYLSMCAGCHGQLAMGDGPMRDLLSIAPTDLTTLAAGNDGVFPTEHVVRRIDGTIDVTAHGGSMPVFGLALTGPSAVITAPDGSEVIAPEVIVDIAAWLETLQE